MVKPQSLWKCETLRYTLGQLLFPGLQLGCDFGDCRTQSQNPFVSDGEAGWRRASSALRLIECDPCSRGRNR